MSVCAKVVMVSVRVRVSEGKVGRVRELGLGGSGVHECRHRVTVRLRLRLRLGDRVS